MLNFINKLQLSLVQWVMLSLAALVGMLVVALKLQGSALHKAQVQLLEQHIKTIDSSDDQSVKTARDAFSKALYTYHSAKRGE